MKNSFLASGLTLVALCSSAQAQLGPNLIVNGDFSSGNSSFTSEYLYLPSGSTPGNSPAMYPAETYTVGNNPASEHGSWPSFGDHTQDGVAQMLIVNGSEVANKTVWQYFQPLTLTQNTEYFFEGWVANIFAGDAGGAILTFQYLNGSNWVDIGTADLSTATAGVWNPISLSFDSGSLTSTQIRLLNAQTAYDGNDFAVDDINFSTQSRVPEPSGALLASLTGLFAFMRRRRR